MIVTVERLTETLNWVICQLEEPIWIRLSGNRKRKLTKVAVHVGRVVGAEHAGIYGVNSKGYPIPSYQWRLGYVPYTLKLPKIFDFNPWTEDFYKGAKVDLPIPE